MTQLLSQVPSESWNMNARIAAISLAVTLGANAATWLIKRWNKRLRLRFAFGHIDFHQTAREPAAQFSATIYHDKGDPFRIERCDLHWVVREPTADEKVAFEAKHGAPFRVAFSPAPLLELESEANRGQLFSRGDRAEYMAHVYKGDAWELIDPTRPFALIRLYSHGKLVREVDASPTMRLCREIAIKVRQELGLLICDPQWYKPRQV